MFPTCIHDKLIDYSFKLVTSIKTEIKISMLEEHSKSQGLCLDNLANTVQHGQEVRVLHLLLALIFTHLGMEGGHGSDPPERGADYAFSNHLI